MHTTANALRGVGIDVQVEYLGDLRSLGAIRRARCKMRALARGFDIVHSQYGSVCALASLGSEKPLAVTLRGNDWNLHQLQEDHPALELHGVAPVVSGVEPIAL